MSEAKTGTGNHGADSFVAGLESSRFADRIVHHERIPAREGLHAEFPSWMHPLLIERLSEAGIGRLYSHQAQAIEMVVSGRNVAVSTGAASGKSLCYNLPVLQAVLEDPAARAIYLFPTKALAQDQLHALGKLAKWEVVAATYDGDTPADQRAAVRKSAQVVLSNPDMLHASILPNHRHWAEFLAHLRYVVVDELHVYRGVFGSHVANVLRRLRRVVRRYRADPIFIFSSATLPEAGRLAGEILGLPVEEVTGDYSPAGEKSFLLWNPPLFEETDRRRSANFETAEILTEFAKAGLHSIAFSRSRVAAELVSEYARRELRGEGEGGLASRISPYRAGYLPRERRRIEVGLREGSIQAVSATNALELGIDIGELDAVVINGFPGTVMSLRQQAGRAGRRRARSLGILVAHEDALDQYYMRHPEELLSRPNERALIRQDNPNILKSHLMCGAFERPLSPEDAEFFGPAFEGIVEELVREGILKRRGNKAFLAFPRFPAQEVGIRSAGSSFSIVEEDTGSLLGTVEESKAFLELHPGAIYLHMGESYLVTDLDIKGKVAVVSPSTGEYYTQPREEADIVVLEELERKALGRLTVCLGRVLVSRQVLGYRRRRVEGGELLGFQELALPPQELETEAVWLPLPPEVLRGAGMTAERLPGSLHAAEHAAIALLPVHAMCDRWDIGGVSIPYHPDTGLATIFVYDGYPGGIGITRRGYEVAEAHLTQTLEAVRACPCREGCPSCVQSPKCGNFNEPLDKEGAAALLGAGLEAEDA